VVIALVVTAEGLPLAYEVLPGNTADNSTLRGFLDRIERQYGKARRIWLMDRGEYPPGSVWHVDALGQDALGADSWAGRLTSWGPLPTTHGDQRG
jgi:hypothetical protein